MNAFKFRSALLLFIGPIAAFGQVQPMVSPSSDQSGSSREPTLSVPAAPDAAELTRLLEGFLAGASGNDIAAHQRFWAEDVIYTSSAGRRRGKADILRDVKTESASDLKKEKTTYSAEDVRIQEYGATAIVAFRLVGVTAKENGESETGRYLNTGTFVKREGKWQVVAWQATKMATEDDSKK